MDLPYGRALNSTSQLNDISIIDLMARMIYSEARGESIEGMRGVAFVAYNRKDHSQFPSSLKDVLLSGGFDGLRTSAALAPDTSSTAWKNCLEIAMKMPNLSNPIDNCLWFNTTTTFNNICNANGGKYKFSGNGTVPVTVTNRKVIGNHTFFTVEGY